jgi:hypothetical protein
MTDSFGCRIEPEGTTEEIDRQWKCGTSYKSKELGRCLSPIITPCLVLLCELIVQAMPPGLSLKSRLVQLLNGSRILPKNSAGSETPIAFASLTSDSHETDVAVPQYPPVNFGKASTDLHIPSSFANPGNGIRRREGACSTIELPCGSVSAGAKIPIVPVEKSATPWR